MLISQISQIGVLAPLILALAGYGLWTLRVLKIRSLLFGDDDPLPGEEYPTIPTP